MKKITFILSLLMLTSCGIKNNFDATNIFKSSIISGKEVPKNHPLISSVVGIYNAKVKSICTGSLIAPNYVLTAAHCIPKRAQDVKIIFSTNIDYIINSRELDIVQEFALPAIDFKINPRWNPLNETVEVDTGDIAIIKFKGNIPNGYKPATFLENTSELKIGQSVELAGYGVNLVDMEEIDPKTYRKLDDAIDEGYVVCSGDRQSNYGTCFELDRSGDGLLRMTSAPISFIHDTEIRLNEKKSGTCSGDSGGPAYLLKDGIYYLFGVTSRGSELCNEVGVYTNAIYYKSWIEETMKLLGN